MARIPAETVERIKSRADILDVVSDVVRLKRRGRNYFALCPFHEERTPSFSVNPSMGIFHCFGCGKGGNAITFVMEYEKIDYVEALKRLAERYGIEIKWEEGEVSRKGEISLLYELHEIAVDFYQKQLLAGKGENALAYLKGREFDESVLKQFNIGFAPDEWEGLLRILDLERYSPNILEKSGLFVMKERNRFYDRFRNRIMFPIFNLAGRVVAFGGRAMDPADEAKYLNSPETPIYFKSGILYGLSVTKDSIRKEDEAIVVEGYTDFIRLYASGVSNVVAISGTALTFHHGRIVKRFASKATLCYDGDEAGKKATERAGFTLLKEGLDVNVIVMPEGDDPDSFMKNNDYGAFVNLHKEAKEFIPFFVDNNRDSLNTPAEKTLFVERMVEEIAQVRNPVTREFIVQEVSEKLGVSEAVLQRQIRSYYKSRFGSRTPILKETDAKGIQLLTVTEKAEYDLLKILLSEHKGLQSFIIENIQKNHFSDPVMSKLAGVLINVISKGKKLLPSDLFNLDWTSQERQDLSRLVFDAEPFQFEIDFQSLSNLVVDCIVVLKTASSNKKIKELREKIKLAEKSGEDIAGYIADLSEEQQYKKEIESKLRSITPIDNS